MSFIQTVLLGAIAGFTIYLGLPIGRIEKISDRVRTFLTMTSVGILIFLLFDIFSHIKEPIEGTLKQALESKTGAGEFVLLLFIFVIGFAVGLLGLLAFESRFTRTNKESRQPLSPARLAAMIADRSRSAQFSGRPGHRPVSLARTSCPGLTVDHRFRIAQCHGRFRHRWSASRHSAVVGVFGPDGLDWWRPDLFKHHHRLWFCFAANFNFVPGTGRGRHSLCHRGALPRCAPRRCETRGHLGLVDWILPGLRN